MSRSSGFLARLNVSHKLVLGLFGGLLAVMPARANEPRQHDKAFFLRLSAGAGAASATFDDVFRRFPELPSGDLKLSGTSGDVNFAIGGTVSRNLALHATLGGWSVSNPDVEIGGFKGDTDDALMSLSMFGPGLTYYFMPVNLYLSGSLCAATMTLELDRDEEESDTGIAVDLTIGKEWWVGNKWGLGVAAGLNLYSIPTDNEDQDITGSAFAIRLSATYN
ncbi:MAG: hypothetical protein SGI90_16075 [Candidatus Eisenbacteria bacterium]|nr:hypothetical protein [Candidatus Eisenbacteria bacterium]